MSGLSDQRGGNQGPSDLVYFGLPDVFVAKGAHIAHFFRGDQERLTVLVPFISAGLESDECVLVTEPSASATVTGHLRESGVDVDAALASGPVAGI